MKIHDFLNIKIIRPQNLSSFYNFYIFFIFRNDDVIKIVFFQPNLGKSRECFVFRIETMFCIFA